MRDRRAPERHDVIGVGNVAADRAVHLLVLEVEHRIVVTDGGPEEALRVVWGRRDHDLEARHMGEERLD